MTKQMISSLAADGRNSVGNAFGKCVVAHIWGFDWVNEIVYIQMFVLDAKEAIQRNWSETNGIPQGGEMLPEQAKAVFPLLFPAFNWLKVEIYKHGITRMPKQLE